MLRAAVCPWRSAPAIFEWARFSHIYNPDNFISFQARRIFRFPVYVLHSVNADVDTLKAALLVLREIARAEVK